jgi:putative ABC transport system permease protein
MLRTALTTALAHKARLALTSIAIMLGVAFVTGSLVFTDTIQARFDTLFADVYDGVDASVRAEPDGVASGVTTQVGSIPQTLGAEILARDDVAAAEGYVQAFGQVIDADGEPVGGMGAPTYVYSWIDEPDLNPFRITDGDGRAPGASGEVVVDVATADLADLSVGDRVGIQFPAGTETFDLVGVASFGDTDNLAGATITVVPLPDAQRILGMEGRVSFVDVVAAEGVDPARLVDRLGSVVPDRPPKRSPASPKAWPSCRRRCSALPQWRSSSAHSSSTTPSASSWPSAPASWLCCVPSAHPRDRSSVWCSRRPWWSRPWRPPLG